MEWRLLAGVPEEEVREVLRVARRRVFSRGEVVFHREDPADSLHLIVTGRFVVVVMTPLGDTATIAVRGPGESFGEMALVSADARRSATVIALEAGETRAVYRSDFNRLRTEYPSVNDVLIAFLAREVRLLNERLLEAFYVPAERRVLRRLLELSAVYSTGSGDTIAIPLTQEQIAGLAGTSRATVNQVLRAEQERRTLELRRGRVVITNREALAKRAR